MKDFSGLQIDVRCYNCGQLPTADVTLFEMQNHLYICDSCRQQTEQRGRQIRWVNNAQPETPTPRAVTTSGFATRVLTSDLPPNSLFAILNLPLTASTDEIEAAIAQRMRQLLREEDSPERTEKIEQLHEWQEMTEDTAALDKYRDQMKPSRHSGQALSVGGRLVYNLEDFLSACEASREGWADGERYLRTGELQHWIIYQIEDRDLAAKIRYYQNLKTLSNFRAFNESLYCLVPERPFRLYKEDVWQSLNTLSSASTSEELARLCDLNWRLGENHLYEGSMGYWLEVSRGITGLKAYYDAAVVGYATAGKERGVGLELLLERALPSLPKPNLVVTFDGHESEYTLKRWDREIPHRPIKVKVTNTTRGFTSFDMKLEQPRSAIEPNWIALNDTRPIHVAGIPGDGSMPMTSDIKLMNLASLERGRKYQRVLTLSIAGEYGKPPTIQKFPITFGIMGFFRGLRGRLWQWGLRGGLVGLAWNFAAGALLAFLLSLLLKVIPTSYLYETTYEVSFGTIMQNLTIGTLEIMQQPLGDLPPTWWNTFPLIVGAITGLVGFGVGNFKGHTDYTEKRSASSFRVWTFWFAVALTITLLIVDQGGTAIVQAFQYGPGYNGNYAILYGFQFGGGSIILGVLTFIISCIVASARYRVEKYLRTRYKELLNPPGRA